MMGEKKEKGGKRRGRKGEEKKEKKREEKGRRKKREGNLKRKKNSVECLVMNEVILVSNQIHVDAEERETSQSFCYNFSLLVTVVNHIGGTHIRNPLTLQSSKNLQSGEGNLYVNRRMFVPVHFFISWTTC